MQKIRCFFTGHEFLFKQVDNRLYAECMNCLAESKGYINFNKEELK